MIKCRIKFNFKIISKNTSILARTTLPAGISSAEKENPHRARETKYASFRLRTIFFLVVVLFQNFALFMDNGFWFVLVMDDLPNNKWQSRSNSKTSWDLAVYTLNYPGDSCFPT